MEQINDQKTFIGRCFIVERRKFYEIYFNELENHNFVLVTKETLDRTIIFTVEEKWD